MQESSQDGTYVEVCHNMINTCQAVIAEATKVEKNT